MKFELVLFERDETTADLKATVVCTHQSREAVENFINAGKNYGDAREGGFVPDTNTRPNGRSVRLVSVSSETPLSGFSYADSFPSAQAASNALRVAGLHVTQFRLKTTKGS
jgi:hypothetical protein